MLGKIIGAVLGYSIGGFLGLLIGVFIGHQVDKVLPSVAGGVLLGAVKKHQEKVQRVFFEATFTVMGHLAKADGRVSEQEIHVARQVMQRMNLSQAATREAMELFGRGKEPDFNLDAMLQSLGDVTRHQHNLMRMFIEIQLAAGYADGALAETERNVLLRICSALGFSQAEFERLEAMIQAEIHRHQPGRSKRLDLGDAYAILSLDETATDAEVKRAYRRLTGQHHPDKLAAKGLPKEMMKLAEEKTHEIRTAYERIREERGIR